MLGDFTWTSAMSGAATNTVEAAPGNLIAVPLLTSRVSVGCCGGTTWLCANGRPDAPLTDGGAGAAPGAVGWIGVGGRACTSRICGAGVAGASAVATGGGGRPTVGVRAALTVVARAGKAIAGLVSTGLASADLASGSLTSAAFVSVLADAAGAASSAALAVRSASRRLSSSATLSVGVTLCAGFFLAVLGLAWAGTSGSLATCSITSVDWKAKPREAASASTAPMRRQAGGRPAGRENDFIVARLWCG